MPKWPNLPQIGTFYPYKELFETRFLDELTFGVAPNHPQKHPRVFKRVFKGKKLFDPKHPNFKDVFKGNVTFKAITILIGKSYHLLVQFRSSSDFVCPNMDIRTYFRKFHSKFS